MPILGVVASAVTKGNPSYNFIATYALASDQRTITFSSIPQIYTHLEFRIVAKSDHAGGAGGGTFAYATFAGSDANYGLNQLRTDNISTGTTGSGTDPSGYVGAPWERLSNGSDNSNVFGIVTAIIPNYRNTNMLHSSKSFGSFNRTEGGSAIGAIYNNSTMYYANKNAVTTVTIVPGDGGTGTKFKAGSVFSLYGIG
jgi:hypothetical protein